MAGLRRDLGLLEATTIIVGSMIGSGIFLGPERIAKLVPDPWLVMLVWVVAGAFILTGALCFAELGAMFPKSGGHYVYVREAYGSFPAFLNGWSLFLVTKSASVAALAAGFSLALSGLLGWPAWALTLLSVSVIALLAGVNYVGVKQGGRVQNLTTGVKVGALVGLGIFGLVVGLRGGIVGENLSSALGEVATGGGLLAAFGLALVPALWAYDGWANASQVAEEVRDPEKNLPRALIGGVLLVLAVYTFIILAYLLTLGVDGIAASTFAAGDAAAMMGGDLGRGLISAAVIISILGTLNAVTLSGPRIYYAMARDQLFFDRVRAVHPRFGTPSFSIVLQSGWAILLVLLFDFHALLNYVIVVSWVFYGLAGLALITLRRKRPGQPRPFRTPLYPWIPLAFVAFSFAFVLNAAVNSPSDALMGLLVLVSGVPFYLYWHHRDTWDRWVARTPQDPAAGGGEAALTDREVALLAYVEAGRGNPFRAEDAANVLGLREPRDVLEALSSLAGKMPDRVRVAYEGGVLVVRTTAPAASLP